MLATGSVQHRGRCLELRHEESIYIWYENFADYATIYSSINRLLPPPPPRDPRPRRLRAAGLVVVSPFLRVPPMLHGRCRSLHLSRDNVKLNHRLNHTTQSLSRGNNSSINRVLPPPPPLDPRTAAGIVVVTPFLPPALQRCCRALPLSRGNIQLNQPAAVPSARAVVSPCSSLSPISWGRVGFRCHPHSVWMRRHGAQAL